MEKRLFRLALVAIIPGLLTLQPAYSGAVEKMPGESDALLVTPETLDLGMLGPGGQIKGIFFMQSPSSKVLDWSTPGPEGWGGEEHGKLKGRMRNSLGYLEVSLRFTGSEVHAEEAEPVVQMTLECEGETLTLEKGLPFGPHSERIDLSFEGGVKPLLLKFETVLSEPGPQLAVEPRGLDFGTLEGGKTAAKKMRIRNVGKGKLIWKTGIRGGATVAGEPLRNGFYVSFQNEDLRGRDEYSVPGRLENILQIDGRWLIREGEPASSAEGGNLRYSFSGTAIAVILRSEKNQECVVKASIDDGTAIEIDGRSEDGRVEVTVAENLQEGPHVLTVAQGSGTVWIEGVLISSGDILTGVPGWINVFPGEGTTRSENYATVTVNSETLKAGLYSGGIMVQSNGGDIPVDLSLRVTRDRLSKIIEVYCYARGNDYLYTGQPETEDYQTFRNYKKQRLAFRLFREDTPGTKKFHRWYNAARGDHYYSTDPEGGRKSLQGYVPEGSIGNIGTSRILGTRELYRWYNPSTGRHFYTTEVRGEGMEKKGYRFDGIAGYVR